MGLSNETAPNTATVDSYIATLDLMRASNLASRLVTYEHNPDPREAENPAHGVRIRKILPVRHVQVDQDCKDHNTAVQSLGLQGTFTR